MRTGDDDTDVVTVPSNLDLEVTAVLAKDSASSENVPELWETTAQLTVKALERRGAFGRGKGLQRQLRERTREALGWVMAKEIGPWQVSLNRVYTVTLVTGKNVVAGVRISDGKTTEAILIIESPARTTKEMDSSTSRIRPRNGDDGTTYVVSAIGIRARKRNIIHLFGRPAEELQPDRKELPGKETATVSNDMEELCAIDQSVMIEGLKARISAVGNEAETRRMQQVYEAFCPYTQGKELPPGTTPQIMRFLVVSAGVPGLWHKMDETDPRLGDALLGYYANGLSLNKLAGTIAGTKQATQVQRLLNAGIVWLFEELPEASEDFPLDKYREFDLKDVLGTRRYRQRAAGEKRAAVSRSSDWGRRTAAVRWWQTGNTGDSGSLED